MNVHKWKVLHGPFPSEFSYARLSLSTPKRSGENVEHTFLGGIIRANYKHMAPQGEINCNLSVSAECRTEQRRHTCTYLPAHDMADRSELFLWTCHVHRAAHWLTSWFIFTCAMFIMPPSFQHQRWQNPVRRDEVFHTPELEPGRGTPHLALSPREISSKTHGLLDYLNIVQANWGAFFSEGMELCKNTPQSLRHPCKSGENWGGGGGKRKRLHTEDFCGQSVFALNPLKTSHCFREPFDVVFTLCVRLWCGLDEGYVNQTHKIPNRLLDLNIDNVAHGTL